MELEEKTRIGGGSPERFGYSWENFSEYSKEQESQFIEWVKGLGVGKFKGKKVLDVGCGAGRNTWWAMKAGADHCTAIDVDTKSLEAAKRNLDGIPNTIVEKRSAYEIGYKKEFDIAFSIGVIHHLEFPLKALNQMRDSVRQGGKVLIWVYGSENIGWFIRILNPFRKYIFSKLPLPIVKSFAWVPTCVLWLFLKTKLYRLAYLKQISKFPIKHLHHIIFDQMLPRIANYWEKSEVEGLMRDAGLLDIKVFQVNQMSWSAVGTVK